jgi:hypothetical protein
MRIMIGYEPIHGYFGLSYAQYLAIPRTILQSMPLEWQQRFVDCLSEIEDVCGDWMPGAEYRVHLYRNDKRVDDPLADYQRGRRRFSKERYAALST